MMPQHCILLQGGINNTHPPPNTVQSGECCNISVHQAGKDTTPLIRQDYQIHHCVTLHLSWRTSTTTGTIFSFSKSKRHVIFFHPTLQNIVVATLSILIIMYIVVATVTTVAVKGIVVVQLSCTWEEAM